MFHRLLTASIAFAVISGAQTEPAAAGSRGLGAGIAAGVIGGIVGAAIANQGARAQPRTESRSSGSGRSRAAKPAKDDGDDTEFASHRGDTVTVSNIGPDPFAPYANRPDATEAGNR